MPIEDSNAPGDTIGPIGSETNVLWGPTLDLRYIRKENTIGVIVRVLQQRWVSERRDTEWRDVPLVTDDDSN